MLHLRVGRGRSLAVACLTAALCTAGFADSATVAYQGVLRASGGAVMPDGNYNMSFSIYEAASGGTLRWGPEAHNAVPVADGFFSVQLGATSLLGSLFSNYSALWLDIAVDGEVYGPRVPLSSVPYARHAAAMDGAGIVSGTISTDRFSAYADLGAELKIGSGAAQVAAGNHTHALNDLSNVSAASPGTGQALTWEASTSRWQAVGGWAIIRDVKPANTEGGSFAANSWITRTLNDLQQSAGMGITLSANQFTLPAGRYYISASAPGYIVHRHGIRLRNVTAGTTQIDGTSEHCAAAGGAQTRSFLEGVLELAASTTFRIEHICGVASNSLGLGVAKSQGTPEVYTTVFLRKF